MDTLSILGGGWWGGAYTSLFFSEKKSETRVTASVLKTGCKHIKGSKEPYLSGQNAACPFSG